MGNWTPSIVPNGTDETVYLVMDDFGHLGRVWRETDVETADLETVITDLLNDQYKSPVRVIGFNTAEGWARDVSEDVAHEIRRRCDDPPASLEDFLEQHQRGDSRQLTLRLV